MGHNSGNEKNRQDKSEQGRQSDNVREMRTSGSGDPRMEDQTTVGRGESATGDRSQSSARSGGGSEQRGLEGGSFVGSSSPTSSGSFAQSEGINRGGTSHGAGQETTHGTSHMSDGHAMGNESSSSGRWSNESDAQSRLESGALSSGGSSSGSATGSPAGRKESARSRSGTHEERRHKAS